MRIRHAATALVSLGAASACAIGGGLIQHDTAQTEARESALRASTWAVQASTDFGTSWDAPVSSRGGHFPVRVDTSVLRTRPAYQPLTLRTTVGSRAYGLISLHPGALISGDPAAAAQIRVRAVESREGTCAAPAFANHSRNLLAADPAHPQLVDAPTVNRPVVLPGATHTTAGMPMTLCLELSTDPVATPVDGQVTLGWPIEVEREDEQA